MTREEEIYNAVKDLGIGAYNDSDPSLNDEYSGCDIQCAFIKGVEWADENPKSPWISVKDDLPCNHTELIINTKYHTVSVFTYKKGGACGIDNMIIRNGKWEWEAWKENYLYWMPIPRCPKE